MKEQRVLSRDAFVRGIQQFKARNNQLFAEKSTTDVAENLGTVPRFCFEVIARKRPLNEKELSSGDFDVVSSGIGRDVTTDVTDKGETGTNYFFFYYFQQTLLLNNVY